MADCDVCRNLQLDRFDADERFPAIMVMKITVPRRAVAQSAQTGCETCSIIMNVWEATTVGLSRYIPYIHVECATAGAPLQISGRNRVEGGETILGDLYTLQGGEANRLWPDIGVSRHVAADPLSTTAMKLANEWLKECLRDHVSCQTRRESQLPTRIIDISPEGDKARLVVTGGSRGAYIALSHCWGNSRPLTTAEATLEDRMNGIPLTEMPKTFRDAIRVTHSLGYRYLWIDSLCIIQDSKKDWDIESSRMQDVYERAVLNISADAAPDSSAGLSTEQRLPKELVV